MKKTKLLLTGIYLIISQISIAQVCTNCLPHTDPNNTGKWQIQNNFSDEFNDNNINRTKWHLQGENGNYYNNWEGRAPSQFVAANITESGETLKITSKWEPNFPFVNLDENGVAYGSKPITTGALITKNYIKHGYLEVKCKVGKSPMSGSFWAVGTSNIGELDVFEHVGQSWDPSRDNNDIPKIMHSSFHSWNVNRPQTNNRVFQHKHLLEFDVTDGFHIYAADWTANYVRFYVDGKLIREVTKEQAQAIQFGNTNGWVVDTDMRIWLDSEIFPWSGSIDLLTAQMFNNAVFEVDYVRVWKRGNNGSTVDNTQGNNLISNGTFANNLNNWNITGNASRPNIANWNFWKDDNPSTDSYCLQLGGGTTRAQQTITVEPNTTYMLTAHMRMPGTTGSLEPKNIAGQNYNTWHNGWYGVEGSGITNTEKKLFLNWFHGYSMEFTTGNSASQATIYFDNKNSGNPMHIDQVSVVKLNTINQTPPDNNSDEFYIINRATGQKLSPINNNVNSGIKQVNTNNTSNWVKWVKVNSDNGWFYLKNVHTGKYFRPKGALGNDGDTMEQLPTSSNGTWTQWKTINANGDYIFLRNRASNKNIRPINGAIDSEIELRPNTWFGTWTQWKLEYLNNTNTSKTNKPLFVNSVDSFKSNNNSVYPNPSNGNFNIDLDNLTDSSMAIITDTHGRIVFNQRLTVASTFVTTNLPNGIYTLKIINSKNSTTHKIVIK